MKERKNLVLSHFDFFSGHLNLLETLSRQKVFLGAGTSEDDISPKYASGRRTFHLVL